jgi:hypothetical protein
LKSEWRLTRSRHADDVNAEVREAVDRDGYSLFRIGLSLARDSKIIKRSFAAGSFLRRNWPRHRAFSPRCILRRK